MYLTKRMRYIRIHPEFIMIHVSTPSHMARPVRLWDTPGYNGIQQDTSARAYPHRLHTWDTWGIHAAMMYPIVAGEIHAEYIQDTCWIQRSMCILEESIRHTSVSISHRGTLAQHHSDPHRAMYSLTGCTRLLELITQDILRVSSCRTRKGARNWP